VDSTRKSSSQTLFQLDRHLHIHLLKFHLDIQKGFSGDTKSRTPVALVVIDVLGDTKSPTPVALVVIDVLGNTKSPTPVALVVIDVLGTSITTKATGVGLLLLPKTKAVSLIHVHGEAVSLIPVRGEVYPI
jgi:hypothetical protein